MPKKPVGKVIPHEQIISKTIERMTDAKNVTEKFITEEKTRAYEEVLMHIATGSLSGISVYRAAHDVLFLRDIEEHIEIPPAPPVDAEAGKHDSEN